MFTNEHTLNLMMRAASEKNTAKRQIRFPGIVADAARLNVNRNTLYKCLCGIWNLPGLRSRYEKLKAGESPGKARAA